eukprot:GEMP01093151.1.p1 GENE.GEMP01093151.1~~GEMP01093151.1.p1  ORF type:complete len:218 (+),score=55.76 GEMP01093151.1:74-727(+)
MDFGVTEHAVQDEALDQDGVPDAVTSGRLNGLQHPAAAAPQPVLAEKDSKQCRSAERGRKESSLLEQPLYDVDADTQGCHDAHRPSLEPLSEREERLHRRIQSLESALKESEAARNSTERVLAEKKREIKKIEGRAFLGRDLAERKQLALQRATQELKELRLENRDDLLARIAYLESELQRYTNSSQNSAPNEPIMQAFSDLDFVEEKLNLLTQSCK